jgi:hypothetical protein
VSAGAIIVIAVAATGILMMRFRKRWLAKINIAVTNRITSLFAGWLPGFCILTHIGRESGKVYQTPVNVFQTHLQQRLRVVEERARSRRGCELNTRAEKYRLSAPKVVRDPTRRRFPIPVRLVLTLVGADEYMEMELSNSATLVPL